LLKYGYSNFSLDIFEYCELNQLIVKEQYFIDMLKPKYNILKIAGSRLGTKHSEATKQLLSNVFKGRVFSEDSLEKMRVAAKLRVGKKSFFGKTHTV
jgi:group I intron endonuclease